MMCDVLMEWRELAEKQLPCISIAYKDRRRGQSTPSGEKMYDRQDASLCHIVKLDIFSLPLQSERRR